MTSKEFEKFLLSIGGLIDANSSDKNVITADICECGEGWFHLISELIAELIAVGWNKEICQIKQKFGGLRFYASELPEELSAIIFKYEQRSFGICEVCGSIENVKLRQGKRLRSLCEKHN
jgi:hypothetical protein